MSLNFGGLNMCAGTIWSNFATQKILYKDQSSNMGGMVDDCEMILTRYIKSGSGIVAAAASGGDKQLILSAIVELKLTKDDAFNVLARLDNKITSKPDISSQPDINIKHRELVFNVLRKLRMDHRSLTFLHYGPTVAYQAAVEYLQSIVGFFSYGITKTGRGAFGLFGVTKYEINSSSVMQPEKKIVETFQKLGSKIDTSVQTKKFYWTYKGVGTTMTNEVIKYKSGKYIQFPINKIGDMLFSYNTSTDALSFSRPASRVYPVFRHHNEVYEVSGDNSKSKLEDGIYLYKDSVYLMRDAKVMYLTTYKESDWEGIGKITLEHFRDTICTDYCSTPNDLYTIQLFTSPKNHKGDSFFINSDNSGTKITSAEAFFKHIMPKDSTKLLEKLSILNQSLSTVVNDNNENKNNLMDELEVACLGISNANMKIQVELIAKYGISDKTPAVSLVINLLKKEKGEINEQGIGVESNEEISDIANEGGLNYLNKNLKVKPDYYQFVINIFVPSLEYSVV